MSRKQRPIVAAALAILQFALWIGGHSWHALLSPAPGSGAAGHSTSGCGCCCHHGHAAKSETGQDSRSRAKDRSHCGLDLPGHAEHECSLCRWLNQSTQPLTIVGQISLSLRVEAFQAPPLAAWRPAPPTSHSPRGPPSDVVR